MNKYKVKNKVSTECGDHLLLKNYDLLYKFNLVYLTGHILIMIGFFALNIMEMVFVNILSIMWFSYSAYKMARNQVEKYVITEKRMMMEVLLHQLIAFYFVGTQIGFHYILLAYATIMFTLYKDSKGKTYYAIKACSMIILFIVLQLYSVYYTPKYSISPSCGMVLTVLIITYAFASSAYFTLKSYTNVIESIEEFEQELFEKKERIQNIQKQVILSMANIIESRDTSTGEHINRTSIFVSELVSEMRKYPQYKNILDENFLDYITLAAPMHDIGKIKIPDRILLKTTQLTKEEFEVIKQHTIYGGELINKTLEQIEDPKYIKMAYNITMHHHEKWNGRGYPLGLEKTEIPIEARIMALVDVYDALTSERCYKDAFSAEEAYRIIEDELGSQFDPFIGKIFLDIVPRISQEDYCNHKMFYNK